MPLSRFVVLEQLLRAAGIPLDGLSDSGPPYPAGVTVMYGKDATAAHIVAGGQIVETFDYRPRRSLSRRQLATGVNALTDAQQRALFRHLLVLLVQDRPQEVEDILRDTSIPLAVDEVDPFPPPP